MKHFTFTDWADFANGLSSQEHTNAMQSHLDEGCTKCKKLVETCRRVRSLAPRMAEYEPAAPAVQQVKSAFVLQRPRKRQSPVREIAELMFDSFTHAAAAGVRSMGAESATRKLLYRRGTVQIDLSVDAVSATQSLQIDGQVLDSATPGHVLAGIVVFLASGKHKLAQGQTNPMGEFHLECPSRDNLSLGIWISAEREVILPLDDFVPKARGEDSRGSS